MGPSLIAYGTEDQQQRFLPGMLSGDTTWCIGMSEPDAGSDLASLKTFAARDGDRWVIDGQKIWTSFASVADYCYVICRTTTEGPPHRGISEIIVPMDTPGIEVRPVTDMTTNRHFCEVFFTDVRVPIENLVGVEGDAFKQTMRQLEHERGGIDRLVSNRALFDRAVAACDRSDPLVRQEIAALETGYRIGRLLVYREALRQAPAGFSAATKCFCTEHEQRVADFAARVLGPTADRRSRPGPGHRLRPRLHDHGRHLERDAQHPGRTGPRPPPGAQAALSGVGRHPCCTAGSASGRPGRRPGQPGRRPAQPGTSPDPGSWRRATGSAAVPGPAGHSPGSSWCGRGGSASPPGDDHGKGRVEVLVDPSQTDVGTGVRLPVRVRRGRTGRWRPGPGGCSC